MAIPRLARLLTARLGHSWIHDLEKLRKLEPLVDDPDFAAEWRAIKHHNKQRLAAYIYDTTLGIAVDPDSMFDVLVKRLHEYKRQHLKVLHILTLYKRIQHNPDIAMQPRTFIFGGKAAPGYRMAKLIIKLIHSVAAVIHGDPLVRDRLKVVFLPNYNVKLGQRVYPAADLSEQISLAGMEASGTGNMKFAMNGALTIGTLDGANIEIREEVGADNFFLFGLTDAGGRTEKRRRVQSPRLIRSQRPTARDRRRSRQRRILARRPHSLRAPRAIAAQRTTPTCCLPITSPTSIARIASIWPISDTDALDAHVHPQRGAHRQILLRPRHPRLLRRHLEDLASEDSCLAESRNRKGSRIRTAGLLTGCTEGLPALRGPA